MTALKSLYGEDTVAWAEQQAAALRAAAHGGSNQALDWENLTEEIESLGAAQRSALASHVMRIIQHLVKLEYSSTVEPRSGWRLEDSPSLKPQLGQFVAAETARGIELAIADLEEPGEIDEVEAQVLRQARYTEAQVVGDWFPEEPRG